MRFRGPLAESYPAAVVLVLSALTPYLATTSAVTPLMPELTRQVGLSPQSLQLSSGMSNAAYALGTVVAAQLTTKLHGRRLLVLYASLFVVSSALVAIDFSPGLWIAGRVVQGLTTSLMLIAAVPPLVVRWSGDKIPTSAIVLNLGLFGAVALGPVIGGVQAAAHEFQPLFWCVTGVGGIALLFALLTYEDQPPVDPEAPWDMVAIVLAGIGSAALFFGASEMTTHAVITWIVLGPLVGGALLIIALLLHQYHVPNPLMPVRALATTFPVTGILIAMTAGAASVGLIELTGTALASQPPFHTAMLYWPEFGAAIATAVALGIVLGTRMLVVLAVGSAVVLAGGAVVVTGVVGGPHALVIVGSGLIGLGVGGAVAPGLFMAGLSVKSDEFQRVAALVELLRAQAAFIVAPILMHVAMTVRATPAQGIGIAIWAGFGVAALGAAVGIYLLVLGRARLQRPDLDRWADAGGPAWHSPPLADGIRDDTVEPVLRPTAD